jgi:hypothetical protein
MSPCTEVLGRSDNAISIMHLCEFELKIVTKI